MSLSDFYITSLPGVYYIFNVCKLVVFLNCRNTLKEAQSTECRTRAISPETDMVSDMTNAGQSDVDDIMKNKKMMTHKSGSKKRKRGGRIDIGREYKKKSRYGIIN